VTHTGQLFYSVAARKNAYRQASRTGAEYVNPALTSFFISSEQSGLAASKMLGRLLTPRLGRNALFQPRVRNLFTANVFKTTKCSKTEICAIAEGHFFRVGAISSSCAPSLIPICVAVRTHLISLFYLLRLRNGSGDYTFGLRIGSQNCVYCSFFSMSQGVLQQ